MVRAEDPPPSGLLGLALVVGVPLGFFGPVVFLEWLTVHLVPYPAERSYLLAFALPLLPGALVAGVRSSRPWGFALLAGAASGIAVQLAWVWLLISSMS